MEILAIESVSRRLNILLRPSLLLSMVMSVSWVALAAPFSFSTIDFPLASYTVADGINDAGQVVGVYGASGNHGFLYASGTFSTLPQGFLPNGISSSQIVGTYINDTGTHGFLDIGGFSTIDVPGATFTQANETNHAGQIVGLYADATGTHGFLDTGGSISAINVPGATHTEAYAINDAGHIVGLYGDATGNHGFLDIGGNFSTIDVPGATYNLADGINDAGQIVGFYHDATGNHGFFDAGGEFSSINFPGASYTSANGINNTGQIVGFYTDATGEHGFLATSQTIVTPEPSTLGCLLFAGLWLMLPVWRRHHGVPA